MLRIVVVVLLCHALVAVSTATASQADAPQDAKTVDGVFISLSAALVGATIYDIELTYWALEKCPVRIRCYERNPIQRPFVERGKATAYAANLAIDGGLIYAAYRMKASDNRFRRLWWVLPAVGIAGHAIGGTMNVRLVLSWE